MNVIGFGPSESIKGYNESSIAKSENADCVVRGIANAFNIDYDVAHKFASEKYGRKNGRGTNTMMYYNVTDKLSDNNTEVFGKTFNTISYEPVEMIKKKRGWKLRENVTLYTKKGSKISRMTVGSFIKENKVGTFLLSVKGHTFAIKDGVVYGNYNDSKKLRTIVKKVWEIK